MYIKHLTFINMFFIFLIKIYFFYIRELVRNANFPRKIRKKLIKNSCFNDTFFEILNK